MQEKDVKNVKIKLKSNMYDYLMVGNHEAVELASAKVYQTLYNDELYRIDLNNIRDIDLPKQLGEGDFTAIWLDERRKHTNAECKKGTLNWGFYDLVVDVRYLSVDLLEDYIQETTYNSQGWLWTIQSDVLMDYFSHIASEEELAIDIEEGEYVEDNDEIKVIREFLLIHNFQKLKKMMIDEVNKHEEVMNLYGDDLVAKVKELNAELENRKFKWYRWSINADKNKYTKKVDKQSLCLYVHLDVLKKSLLGLRIDTIQFEAEIEEEIE